MKEIMHSSAKVITDPDVCLALEGLTKERE
jgi:hypothetical protein